MLVFVNKKNVEPYYTVLLAVKYAGWRTKVVFYDPFNDLIKMEKCGNQVTIILKEHFTS